MRHETKRRLPLRRGRRGAGGAALLRAQPSGRRPGCSGLPARRHADLRDARAAGPERRRRLSGGPLAGRALADRKSTRLNSSHVKISYAVFCLKKKKKKENLENKKKKKNNKE